MKGREGKGSLVELLNVVEGNGPKPFRIDLGHVIPLNSVTRDVKTKNCRLCFCNMFLGLQRGPIFEIM